jgi:hypothetical protein
MICRRNLAWPGPSAARLRILKSGRPQAARKPFKKMGGEAPYLFEGPPGHPGPSRLPKPMIFTHNLAWPGPSAARLRILKSGRPRAARKRGEAPYLFEEFPGHSGPSRLPKPMIFRRNPAWPGHSAARLRILRSGRPRAARKRFKKMGGEAPSF